jgi:hypothetical protein
LNQIFAIRLTDGVFNGEFLSFFGLRRKTRLSSNRPCHQTDLAYGLRLGDDKRCEAVEDRPKRLKNWLS